MDLYQKQLEIQKSSFKKVDETINKKKSLNKFIRKIAKNVNNYKKKNFLETAKKIVTKDNFYDIFEEDTQYFYKKLAKTYAYEFIDYIDNNSFSQKIYLKELDDINYRVYEKGFEKFINIIFEDFFKILKDRKILKEKQQLASFYISVIPSSEVAKALFIFLSFLKEEKITRQNAGDSFFEITKNAIEESLKESVVSKNVFYDIEEELEELSQEIKQKLSQELIDLVSDYLAKEKEDKEIKQSYLIYPNKKFEKELKGINLDVIRYKPMVCPPRDWESIDKGGFLEREDVDKRFKLLFIKAHTPIERKYIKKEAVIPKEIFNAVNKLQQVGYKINKEMIEVLKFFEANIPKLFKIYPKSSKAILPQIENINSKLELREFIAKGVAEVFKKEIKQQKRARLSKEDIEDKYDDFVEELFRYKNISHKNILFELAKLNDFLKPFKELVDEYKNYKEFFYVWIADFRGRLYTAQSILQPQGSDLIKSFLLFSKSQKLNENGIKWFKIHGANLYGKVDKEPYDVRLKWIEENEEKILNCAKNWKEEEFWQKADEPFEFLAFCFEYQRFKENPQNFETSMPVAIDGSNNGIQHISTFMQDINSARKVNVLPTEKVEDIYKEVAKTFKKLVEEDYEKFKNENKELKEVNGYKIAFKEEEKEIVLIENLYTEWIEFLKNHSFEELVKNLTKKYEINVDEQKKELKELKFASEKTKFPLSMILQQNLVTLKEDKSVRKTKKGVLVKKEKKEVLDERSLIPYILDKIDRSFVKKPVMIDSYGAGVASKSDKFKEELEEMLNLEESYIFRFANYLAKTVDKAINEEIKCSDVYQKFIKGIISKFFKKNKNAKYFSWTTPLGFKVLQMEFKTNSIYLQLDNHRIKVSIPTDKSNIKEHNNGIAPNYVHSLDATHLYMTLNRFDKPIRVIHDSYATLPNDVDELYTILKEEFVNLYSKDIFKEFVFSVLDEKEIKGITSKDIFKKYAFDLIPKIDKEFPLNEVLNSKYMFS